jgi:hypothetical protein
MFFSDFFHLLKYFFGQYMDMHSIWTVYGQHMDSSIWTAYGQFSRVFVCRMCIYRVLLRVYVCVCVILMDLN